MRAYPARSLRDFLVTLVITNPDHNYAHFTLIHNIGGKEAPLKLDCIYDKAPIPWDILKKGSHLLIKASGMMRKDHIARRVYEIRGDKTLSTREER